MITLVTSTDQVTCEYCLWSQCLNDLQVRCLHKEPTDEKQYDKYKSEFCYMGSWIMETDDGLLTESRRWIIEKLLLQERT